MCSLPATVSLAWFVVSCMAAGGTTTGAPPATLRVGVVQMALGPTIADNRDRIVSRIAETCALGARVVVFPEGALRGSDGDDVAAVEAAVAAIRQAAREHRVYVVCGISSYRPKAKRNTNWMFVADPEGREIFRYDKLYDQHSAPMPGVFHIEGIPCSTMICADRWLRGIEEIPIQQGAQISFELSCNFASEWVAPLEWYWYVPRAMRNNAWVIFANTGNRLSGVSDTDDPRQLRHGHSAIIAPDGRIAAAARHDTETVVVADLDLNEATRGETLVRAGHPAFEPFWKAGMKLQEGHAVDAPSLRQFTSAETEITLAAAQVTGDVEAMVAMIGEAHAKGADLIAFPERAISETSLTRLQVAAREHRVTVVVGMEHEAEGGHRNSAFVLGPEGAVLTRYDQLSAAAPLKPGVSPKAMWFRVKGVPAVVTIGRDALWSELAELAAVAGAQIHVHLDHDASSSPDASLRRLQVWSNMASFQTFTVTANVIGSAIWDDLGDMEERRAEVRDLARPNTGAVEIYSPFSANLVVQAGAGPELVLATRRVRSMNQYHPRRTSNFNPQMDAWYRLGAAIIAPE